MAVLVGVMLVVVMAAMLSVVLIDSPPLLRREPGNVSVVTEFTLARFSPVHGLAYAASQHVNEVVHFAPEDALHGARHAAPRVQVFCEQSQHT